MEPIFFCWFRCSFIFSFFI